DRASGRSTYVPVASVAALVSRAGQRCNHGHRVGSLPMTVLQFIASLVRSLAWPAAVAFMVFLLRLPIRGLLARVSKVRGGGIEVEMEQAVETGVRRGLAVDAVVRAEVSLPADIVGDGDVPTFLLT